MLDDDADELVARRIFEPAFQVRLLEGRPAFLGRFQYERGTVVLIDDDHVERPPCAASRTRSPRPTPWSSGCAGSTAWGSGSSAERAAQEAQRVAPEHGVDVRLVASAPPQLVGEGGVRLLARRLRRGAEREVGVGRQPRPEVLLG